MLATPLGRISEDREGDLCVDVGFEIDRVEVCFGMDVEKFGLTYTVRLNAEAARNLSARLAEAADLADAYHPN